MAEPALTPDALWHDLEPLLGVGRLWLAYSGGLDSTVLLHLAVALRGRLDRELVAVHIDHGLDRRSRGWMRLCRDRCERLGVALTTHQLHLRPQPGESLEAQAREARYATFAALLDDGDVLATAHHRDDQVETLLLALLRGSGVHGLAAMPMRAPLGRGHLVRPLLRVARASLARYAVRERLCWITDPSNADLGLDRNLLRHRIVPLLRERWPNLDRTIARSAGHCATSARLLDELADDLLAGLSGSRPGTLSIRALGELTEARRLLVLRRWLVRQGFRRPSSDRLRRILSELVPARRDRSPRIAWSGCQVRRFRDDLYALAPLPTLPHRPIPWNGSEPLDLPGGLGRLELSDQESGAAERCVCFRPAGVRCRSGAGPAKTLKNLFQEAGIPDWLRPYVPVLMIDGRVVAVAGVIACDPLFGQLRWHGHPWQRFGLFATE
jgi:tRNA(Ile)-lysidine synthase